MHRGALVVVLLCLLAACSRTLDPPQALQDARALLERGESGEARVLLKNLLVQHPRTDEARVLLARIALDAGDAKAADDELSPLDRASLSDAESLFVRGETDAAMGRWRDVLRLLDSEPAQALSASQRARLRAAALRGLGTPADALPELRASLAADPGDAAVLVALVETLAQLGNLPQAEREVSQFLAANPAQPDALLLRAQLRLRQGAAAEALADTRRVLVEAPASWPLVRRLTAELLVAETLIATGAVAEARQQLAAIERTAPGTLGGQLLGARVALLEGRVGEAADVLQQLEEALPGNAQVQYSLVDALMRGGNFARAAEVLERRVKAVPEDQLARRLLARLLLMQSRPDEVVRLFEGIEGEAGTGEAEADGLLAEARLARARAGASIAALSAKLAADATNATLRAELAAAHLAGGDPQRALAILREGRQAPVLPLAAATELGALRAIGNERELNLLVQRLTAGEAAGDDVLIAAADAAQRGGRNDVASRLVDAVLARDGRQPEALLRRANLEFLAQRYDAASAALRALQGVAPERLDVPLALARVAEARGEIAEARRALETAVQAQPGALEPALSLAALELRAGRAEAAAAVLDRAIGSAPNRAVAAAAAGRLLLDARRYAEARTRFRAAADLDGTVAEHWFDLGRAQLALDDRAAARLSFERAAALRPDWIEAAALAVRLALAQRERAAARATADALLKALERHPTTWLLQGQVALAEGRFDLASRAFGQSYALRPTAAAAVGDHEARIAAALPRPEVPLQNWLARQPGDVAALRRLADYFLQAGRPTEALVPLERLLEKSPNDVAALNNAAWVLASRDLRRAETLARRARAIAPQNPAIADTLGWVLLQGGQLAEAREVLGAAVAGLPDNPAVRYHHALALMRSGEREAARAEIQRALAASGRFAERAAAEKLAQELGL